jgi:WD40 repeat protein
MPVELRGHDKGFFALVISDDSRWLVTHSSDKNLLWDLKHKNSSSQPRELPLFGDNTFVDFSISPDSGWLLARAHNKGTLWRLGESGEIGNSFELHGYENEPFGFGFLFSTDSRWLVTAGKSTGHAHLWDLKGAWNATDNPRALLGNEGELEWPQFSPDGHWLVTYGGLSLWDLSAPSGRSYALPDIGYAFNCWSTVFSSDILRFIQQVHLLSASVGYRSR